MSKIYKSINNVIEVLQRDTFIFIICLEYILYVWGSIRVHLLWVRPCFSSSVLHVWFVYMAVQKQDDQHKHTFSSYVRIQDVVLKTCLGRWTIGRSGERGSGISMLPARHDDDDDDILYTSVDLMNENCFTLKKKKKPRNRQCPAETIIYTDYADDLVLPVYTPAQTKSVA